MIGAKDVYHVVEALLPLYVAMFLAYASVRWWGIFTPVQCSGVNRFVAMFAVPVLSFHIIASSNMYDMNYTFIAADSLQKVSFLGLLASWSYLRRRSWIKLLGPRIGLEWGITLFSVSTLPNTLIIGIPLLEAMYGQPQGKLMVQIIVFQSVVWYNVLLILFEYRAAKILLFEQFPNQAHQIASVKVDSDVASLSSSGLLLETEAESDHNGRLHVRVKRSSLFGSASSSSNYDIISSSSLDSFRLSNVSGVELYSVHMSPIMYGSGRHQPPITVAHNNNNSSTLLNMPPPPPVFIRSSSEGGPRSPHLESNNNNNNSIRRVSSERCPPPPRAPPPSSVINHELIASSENGGSARKSASPKIISGGGDDQEGQQHSKSLPAASVLTKLILIMVWRKLTGNPNTYASLLGVVWSLVSNRWGIKLPNIVQGCITIISNTGLGMAVFSLGLFMALQPKLITCGKMAAVTSMGMKFLGGPAVMAVTSLAVGIRGKLLHVAIIQAALPQGIVPFVFAKEYNVHADILSTCAIFGMLIALPITILYNVLLEL